MRILVAFDWRRIDQKRKNIEEEKVIKENTKLSKFREIYKSFRLERWIRPLQRQKKIKMRRESRQDCEVGLDCFKGDVYSIQKESNYVELRYWTKPLQQFNLIALTFSTFPSAMHKGSNFFISLPTLLFSILKITVKLYKQKKQK